MPASRFLLTDSKSGTSDEHFSLGSETGVALPGAADWSIRKGTLRGGTSEGVEVVTIHNGALTLRVFPTRGMGIWKARLGNLDVGWQSPVRQPVHPAFVPLEAGGGLAWLRGFNELVARCGLASNGPPGPDPGGNPLENPLTLHGRIANLPAHHVEVEIDDGDPGTIRLIGLVDEVSLFGTNLRLTSILETRAGSHEFVIRDAITNQGGTAAESQLLYHVNIGPPILEAGSRIVVPAAEIAPRDARAAEGIADWPVCAEPTAGFTEQVYFVDPLADSEGETFALLRNAAGDQGISVHFDQSLSCLSLWKNTAAIADGYVVGLEPATNYPNHRSFERAQGRVVTLDPGESHEMSLRIALHDQPEAISELESRAEQMNESIPCQTHPSPRAGWSPA